MADITIKFEFAKWKLEQYKKCVEKLREELARLKKGEVNHNHYAALGRPRRIEEIELEITELKGKADFWKELVYATCDHEYEEIRHCSGDMYTYPASQCSKCGIGYYHQNAGAFVQEEQTRKLEFEPRCGNCGFYTPCDEDDEALKRYDGICEGHVEQVPDECSAKKYESRASMEIQMHNFGCKGTCNMWKGLTSVEEQVQE